MIENLESKITDTINQKGPLTGLELKELFKNEDSLVLWQTCARSKNLVITRVGTRYMRLDRRIDGYACLSPSILREFLSYSVLGPVNAPEAAAKKVNEIAAHIETISKNKFELAYNVVSNMMEPFTGTSRGNFAVSFIIAGDVVYNMAHDVPRPERSTGKLVNGSDLDLIVVLEDGATDDYIKSLDNAIYTEKYRLLTFPAFKEEIDYVIKRMSRVREQVQFDTLKHMIACKILDEGCLLYGSEPLFNEVKALLKEHKIPEKISDLKEKAQAFRKNAEEYLLHADPHEAKKESLYLFYPHEESEEFE